MGWSEKYKKSIDCDNPKGFSQKAHCQGRKKNVKEDTDGIGAKSKSYNLKKWFDDGGWVQTGGKYDGKPCAKQPGQTTKPFCRDPDDRKNMSKLERTKRASKKRREDPNPDREGKAEMVTTESSNPLMSGMPKPQAAYEKLATDLASDLKKQATLRDAKNARIQQQASQSKMAEEKDACYRKVKSRYKIWPSAYASGALVKCRKVGAGDWGNKKEDYNFSNWRDDFKATEIESIDLIKPDPIKIIEKKEDPCWDGYKQEGMKKKGKRMVPNCVPEEVEVQRYCPKCKKEETRSQCKFGPKYWDLYSTPVSLSSDAYDPNDPHPANEEKDHEYSMARSEISTIVNAAKRLKKKMGKGEGNIEAWVQSKITKAADYLDSAADYVDSGEMKNESVYNEQKLSKSIIAKGEGGSPYEPYNKPKGPSQPTQPPEGFDKFREKYGIPKKPSLQIAHYIQDNDLVDEQVKPLEGPYDKDDLIEYSNWRADFGLNEQSAYGPQTGGWKIGQPVGQHLAQKSTSQKIKDAGAKYGKKVFGEDWQKVNRKDKTDGMSQAAVDEYLRQNKGSKLKTAVTGDPKPGSKDAKRRKSFCARSEGQQDMHNIDCSKDPDKAICKARRRWKC